MIVPSIIVRSYVKFRVASDGRTHSFIHLCKLHKLVTHLGPCEQQNQFHSYFRKSEDLEKSFKMIASLRIQGAYIAEVKTNQLE